MSTAQPVRPPGANGRGKERAELLDDASAAALLIEVEQTRTPPAKDKRGRLDQEWGEGVAMAQQDGLAGVERWLKTIRGRDPARCKAIAAALDSARDGDEAEPDGIVDRWPEMEAAAFYGIAGEIAMAVDPHTEASPAAVLLQLLAGFANAVDRGPHWAAGATKHYMSIYIALVGPTASGRKGSSWDMAHYFLGHMDETWAAERVKNGMASGEGLIYHVRDKTWKPGKTENDPEIVEDHGVADKRLFLIEPELGRSLKAMNRDSSTLSAVLRSAWDCSEKLSTLTKNSTNVATRALFGVVGHITKSELESLLSKSDSSNGLGNRFLWACVRRSKFLPDGGQFFEFEQDWRPLIDRLKGVFERARAVRLMERDQEARAIWRGVYHELAEGKPGLLGSMLARAEPQVMRLACVFALLDGTGSVGSAHLNAALAVWRFVESSSRYIFGESLGDPRAEKLLAALKAAPQGLTQSEISISVFARNLAKSEQEKMLGELLNLGLVHRTTRQGGRGRPAVVWFAGSACRGTN